MRNILYSKKYPKIDIEKAMNISNDASQHSQTIKTKSFEEFMNSDIAKLTYEPIPEREEYRDKFIQTAIAIADEYEVDIEVVESDGYVEVGFFFDNGKIFNGIKRMIAYADEISFMTEMQNRDIAVYLKFYTHSIYTKSGRRVSPL